MFWIARDGNDIYIYWGNALIGVVGIADWSFAIANPKPTKSRAA